MNLKSRPLPKRCNDLHNEDTRSRLLRAATEVFVELGYEAASVRRICARAGANVALINYYFGDKLGLYSEVLQRFVREAPLVAVGNALSQDGPPEAILRDVIRIRLRSAIEGDKMGQLLRLLIHELARPTPALAQIMTSVALPIFKRGLELIGSILGLSSEHQETKLCARSVAGQVMFYILTAPIVARLWPEEALRSDRVDRIADHITDFSMA